MPNTFAHIELNTGDVAAAKKFYARLFDWKTSEMPGTGYTMLDVGEKDAAGGGMKKKTSGSPTAWVPYVSVESVKATLAKAQEAGAQIVVPFTDIGDKGAIGVFLDPTGAALGVWQAKKGPPAKKARQAVHAAAKKAAKAAKVIAKVAAKRPAKKAAKKK